MTWYVKKVVEIFHEHKVRGRETWIEDTVGKRLAPSDFGIANDA